MKKMPPPSIITKAAMLVPACLVIILATRASAKDKPPHERGWIGGEYRVAESHGSASACAPTNASPATNAVASPKSSRKSHPEGILVFKLDTKTPAAMAGLQKGDVILQLDHQSVTNMHQFRDKIDASKPGTPLTITACRDGSVADYNVPVGREKFMENGMFMVGFPGMVHNWGFWPPSGISFVFLGYRVHPDTRHQMGARDKSVDNPVWDAWLAIFAVSRSRHVIAQESVPLASASLPVSTALAQNPVTKIAP